MLAWRTTKCCGGIRPAGPRKSRLYTYGTAAPGGEVSCSDVNDRRTPTVGFPLVGLSQSLNAGGATTKSRPKTPGEPAGPDLTRLMAACLRTAGRGVVTVTLLVAARSSRCRRATAPGLAGTVNCGTTDSRSPVSRPPPVRSLNSPIAQ